MAGDDLDLSEFEEFSSTAKKRAGRTSRESGGGGSTRGASSGPRRWPWFLTGLLLGAVLAVFGPDLAAPYLPPVLQPGGEEVRGPVVAKRTGNDRVLLTVDTERGALLATFRERVPEIDLLVEEGDTVTLGIPEYAPLVEDPVLAAVRKGHGGGAREQEAGSGAPAAAGAGAAGAATSGAAGSEAAEGGDGPPGGGPAGDPSTEGAGDADEASPDADPGTPEEDAPDAGAASPGG